MVVGEASECEGGGSGDAESSLRIRRNDMLAGVADDDDDAKQRSEEVCETKSERCYVFARV